ncbi:hypothetical protein CARUB_v10006409mg, partial [Capsella rubella]
MECNKEEARRAMEIAEKKLSKNDYDGAKKFINKAKSLFPKLDGLEQVLMMVNVYISASNRGGGEEADWYGILGVDPLADNETVKRHYKKLALLLHPDKNKLNGAEDAFKLVTQAWCMLSDKVKRTCYDQRRKQNKMQKQPNLHKPASSGMYYTRPSPCSSTSSDGYEYARDRVDPSVGGLSNKVASWIKERLNSLRQPFSNGNQNDRDSVDLSNGGRSNKLARWINERLSSLKLASFKGNKNARDSTFWTMCNRCKAQGEYLRDSCLDKAILCPHCDHAFIA